MRTAKIVFLTLIYCFTCTAANAAVYSMPRHEDDLVGQIYTTQVKAGDTATTIRQRYETSYKGLLEANQNVNFNKLAVGQKITIPTAYVLPPYRFHLGKSGNPKVKR